MAKKSKLLIRIIGALFLVAAYPAFVLVYTWSNVARSDFPGGRNGPLDAYRHTLASAVVGFTLSPVAVDWATFVLERRGNAAGLMDRHNNHIGAAIGLRANSFAEIEPIVRAQVLRGAINAADPLQTTWLPPERWRAAWWW
jgi:hypothetical protein